jgi:hypothetical protein
MSNKLDLLKTAIADESIPLAERRTAAEHLVTALVDAVPAPAEDDAEVVELVTPWKDDGPLGGTAPMAWRACNEVYGWHKDGPTLAQARKRVHNGLRLRVLLEPVHDLVTSGAVGLAGHFLYAEESVWQRRKPCSV